MKFIAIMLLFMALLISYEPSLGGTIENTPTIGFGMDWPNQPDPSEPDPGFGHVVGGTFIADSNVLEAVRVWVAPQGAGTGNIRGGEAFRVVIASVDGSGIPTGNVIWQSADLLSPVVPEGAGGNGFSYVQPYDLAPNVPLTIGSTYFVGVDNGRLTDVEGGGVVVGATDADTNVVLGLWNNNLDLFGSVGEWTPYESLEFAATVTMSDTLATQIELLGGEQQECTYNGTTTIKASAAYLVSPGDEVSGFEWRLDGEVLSFSEILTAEANLGAHTLSVAIETVNGATGTAEQPFSVVDTIPPAITASFTDRGGSELSKITKNGLNTLTFRLAATDSCDPEVIPRAVGGFPIHDGTTLKIHAKKD